MREIRATLIAEALQEYGRISPCAGRSSLQECFTLEDGRLILWFNTLDGSTRVLAATVG